MRTLAFLATLFLPGTYVAAVFSTGMFNWHVDSDSQQPAFEKANSSQAQSTRAGDDRFPMQEKTISHLFWVYWAITVLLTILVAMGWQIWWNREKEYFDDDIKAEISAIYKHTGMPEQMTPMQKWKKSMMEPRSQAGSIATAYYTQFEDIISNRQDFLGGLRKRREASAASAV